MTKKSNRLCNAFHARAPALLQAVFSLRAAPMIRAAPSIGAGTEQSAQALRMDPAETRTSERDRVAGITAVKPSNVIRLRGATPAKSAEGIEGDRAPADLTRTPAGRVGLKRAGRGARRCYRSGP